MAADDPVINEIFWHSFQGDVYLNNHDIYPQVVFQTNTFEITATSPRGQWVRTEQNGWHYADDIFNCIFLDEDKRIATNISLKFVHKGQINNIPVLFQIMAWCWLGNKPLAEPMMVSLLMHICVTQPQWVKPDNRSLPRQDVLPSDVSRRLQY